MQVMLTMRRESEATEDTEIKAGKRLTAGLRGKDSSYNGGHDWKSGGEAWEKLSQLGP